MKIISWNVNGLRAIYKKGFWEWFEKIKADIVCLQETKIQEEQLSFDLVKLKNYSSFFNSASKKGYSGVGVFSKKRPLSVKRKLGLKRFDSEGRFLELQYPEFTLINLYLPHGGRQKENLAYKLEVYQFLFKYLEKIKSPEGKQASYGAGKLTIGIPSDFDLKNNLRIPAEGMPRFNNLGRGDLIVELIVKTPKKINPKVKKILEDLGGEIE